MRNVQKKCGSSSYNQQHATAIVLWIPSAVDVFHHNRLPDSVQVSWNIRPVRSSKRTLFSNRNLVDAFRKTPSEPEWCLERTAIVGSLTILITLRVGDSITISERNFVSSLHQALLNSYVHSRRRPSFSIGEKFMGCSAWTYTNLTTILRRSGHRTIDSRRNRPKEGQPCSLFVNVRP